MALTENQLQFDFSTANGWNQLNPTKTTITNGNFTLQSGIIKDGGTVVSTDTNKINTNGKSNIESIQITSNNDVFETIDIITAMINKGVKGTGNEYESESIVIDNFETINSLEYIDGDAPQLKVNANVKQETKYLVSNNNRSTWYTYKSGSWQTALLTNIANDGMTKTEIQSITSAQWKNWFVMGTLDIAISIKGANITGVASPPNVSSVIINFPPNEAPLINNPQVTPDTIHNEYVTLTAEIVDQEADQVQYQVWINGNQVYPATSGEWSPLVASGFSVSQSYNYTYFNVGSNTIMLKVRDSRGIERNWSANLLVTNTNPTITITYGNFNLEGVLGDDDGDSLGYKISINGIQKYPTSGYTALSPSPQSINYNWSSDDLNYGQLNTITLDVIDSFGGVASTSFDIIGTYQGLLFVDDDGNYYTTDKGQILKILDFGIIVSGFNSEDKKVRLVNQNYYAVKNLLLEVDKTNIQPYTDVKISKLGSDWFNGQDSLLFTDTIASGGEIEFYIKVLTEMLAAGGATFDIKAKADVAN